MLCYWVTQPELPGTFTSVSVLFEDLESKKHPTITNLNFPPDGDRKEILGSAMNKGLFEMAAVLGIESFGMENWPFGDCKNKEFKILKFQIQLGTTKLVAIHDRWTLVWVLRVYCNAKILN